MGYLYDKMVTALGGAKLIGRQDMAYGNWTPNGVRSVGIFRDVIVVEYHPPYNKGKVVPTPLNMGEVLKDLSNENRMKNPLDAFNHKKFMTLEEIIIDSMIPLDGTKFLSRLDPKARFRQISIVNWSESMSKAYLNRVPAQRQKSPSALLVKGMSMQVGVSQSGPGESDWYSRIALTSNVYESDKKDGPLDKYFRHVANQHGVSNMEAKDGEVLEEREILNIKMHRQNVKADASGLENLNVLMNQIMRLKKGADSPKADTKGAKTLHKRLVQSVKRGEGVVPGLKYYVSSFQEEDSIPQDLIGLYERLGYMDDKGNPSKGQIKEANGYFDYTEGVLKSVRAAYKERKNRKLYVPDADRYIPSLANLHEFVSLILSEEFDYVKYSAALENIANGGVEDAELAEKIRRRLEQAEGSDKEQVRETAKVIKSAMNEDKDSANAEFFEKIRNGSVSAGRDVYINHISGGASEAVNSNFGWVKKSLLEGLKMFVSKKRPWGFIVSPFIDAVGNVGGEHLLEQINVMFDDLDKYVEGERVDGGSLDPSMEQSLIGVFEKEIYWKFGLDLMYRFLADVNNFSNLKKRQVSRLARSKTGIVGLGEFLERHKDLVGIYGKPLFEEWDYLKVVDGRKDTSIDYKMNLLLFPKNFYYKVFENFNKLSNRQEKRAQNIVRESEGPHALAELDSLCREAIGLQSRDYGQYSPRHREKDPGMIDKARGMIGGDSGGSSSGKGRELPTEDSSHSDNRGSSDRPAQEGAKVDISLTRDRRLSDDVKAVGGAMVGGTIGNAMGSAVGGDGGGAVGSILGGTSGSKAGARKNMKSEFTGTNISSGAEQTGSAKMYSSIGQGISKKFSKSRTDSKGVERYHMGEGIWVRFETPQAGDRVFAVRQESLWVVVNRDGSTQQMRSKDAVASNFNNNVNLKNSDIVCTNGAPEIGVKSNVALYATGKTFSWGGN